MSKKQRNVFKKLVMVVFAFVLVFTSVTPAFAKTAKAPSLNATKVTIVAGKTFNFNVSNKIKGSKYEWKSSNEKVAVVNPANGLVTGLTKGNATVSCRIKTSNAYIHLKAQVTVLKPAVKVNISNPVKTLKVGQYYNLNIDLIPASSNDQVTWTSSDSSIAKPASNGTFTALKDGTVTITATTLSGRSDSVVIKVGNGTSDVVEKEEKDEKEVTDEVKVIKTVYSEDFSSSLGKFKGRGSAAVSQTTAGIAAEAGKGYMKVTGRTANWNGAIVDVTDLVTPGASYRVTGWVRYTTGADVEIFKITQESSGTYPQISGDVEVKKGEWTKVSGIMEVLPSSRQSMVYFEANSLIDFFADNFVIEQIEAEVIVEAEVEKAKVGDVVVKKDFEDGSGLDTRASSVITNTNDAAKSGKASVEIKRTAGWDGAGIRFNTANNIVKASYYGMTVHTSVYVMYKDGPDQVEFKLNNKMEKDDNSDNILSQIAVKKGEWTLIEADCFIADGAVGDMIFIETVDNGALTFYIDDLDIKVVK